MLNEIAPRTRPYRDNADQVPGGSDLQSPAFRADYTFFITCGTSIANQVAYDALAGANKRILVDRTAHQSIHIAAGQSSASVDYAPISTFHPARRPPTALDAARRIAASGTPITVLVTQSAHKSVHTPSARTARKRRRGTVCLAAALHRVAASKYTCTRVLEHAASSGVSNNTSERRCS